MKLAPTVKLNNGYEMPILGLGTYNVSLSLLSVKLVNHLGDMFIEHSTFH